MTKDKYEWREKARFRDDTKGKYYIVSEQFCNGESTDELMVDTYKKGKAGKWVPVMSEWMESADKKYIKLKYDRSLIKVPISKDN